ncbi:MAG: DUF2075 domain-containing protein [Actinomycetes bacterium]|nr:DUF2075 domain-containing protein [Actinomycetes bacterium]
MAFKLPNWSELSKVQRETLELDTGKSWVIPGSPGTGKSVLALYRAVELIGKRKKVLFLVYNKNLQRYLESARKYLDSQPRYKNYAFENLEIRTYHSYFHRVYGNYRTRVPLIDPNNGYSYDFAQIERDLVDGRVRINKDHIIVDEAQDFPESLIKALKAADKPVTCFIDDNQKITSETTNYHLALSVLGDGSPYFLDTNYRNTEQIVELSKIFYDDDNLATSKRSGDIPEFYRMNHEDQIEGILNVIDNHPGKTVGIFVERRRMSRLSRNLENSVVDFEYYFTNRRFSIDFESDNPKVFTPQTMKGLEFDIVIIPYFDEWDEFMPRVPEKRLENGRILLQSVDAAVRTRFIEKSIYVGITRAGDNLYCFYERDSDTVKKIKQVKGASIATFYDSDEDSPETESDTRVSWSDLTSGDDVPY